MADFRAFTRELMKDAERDLGTKLEWVAVDHWNTDNPHIHVLVRGRADDGRDLVISRDYISEGFRQRAAERVALELGPRTESEIQREPQEGGRGRALDRPRPGASQHRRRARRLRGPATRSGRRRIRSSAACSSDGRASSNVSGLPSRSGRRNGASNLTSNPTLRDLGARGDIIKTMHQAIRRAGREPDVSGFALHGEEPVAPIVGRLVERGLQDELKGTAYAIVEGVDGRTHHLRFADLELTGDAELGAIVEVRSYSDANGRKRLSLAIRSDLTIDEQAIASGATWLDRQLIAREPLRMGGGFGAEVLQAMDRRVGPPDRAGSRRAARPKGRVRPRPLEHVAPA